MEVPEAPGASESDPGGGRRGARIERLRAALSLPTLRRATGLLDGRHKSVFVGRGQDFDDMSFYRPGDDISGGGRGFRGPGGGPRDHRTTPW